jgi:hypothetical protein
VKVRQGSSKEIKAQNKFCNLSRACNLFVVGLVELGERYNQMYGAEYYKPKHEFKSATRLNHDEHELNKATEK